MKPTSALLMLLLGLSGFALSGCGSKDEPAPAPADTLAEGDFTVPPTPEAAAASAAAQARAVEACGPVGADGFCGVKFGMTVAAAKAAYPGKLDTLTGDDAPDPRACFELFGNAPIEGVSFMVEQARIDRVDFLEDGPKSTDGFGVGSEAETIRARYGAMLKERPNKYEPDVTELVVETPPSRQVFEIQDGKVRAWRVGVAPAIDYVEHCG